MVEQQKRKGTPVQDGDFGPGTGAAAPPDEATRMPAATVVVDRGSKAAPLIPPDIKKQADPEEGHATSSTDPLSAAAGKSDSIGQNHVRYTDEAGADLDPRDIFDVKPDRTWAEVKQTVHRVFTYPGATTPTTSLAYVAKAKVPLAEVARVKAAADQADAQAKQSHPAERTPAQPAPA